MFTICTLFSTLTTKHNVYVKGASNQTSAPKNSTPGTANPGCEIPESATAISQPKDVLFKKTCLKLSQWFWKENKSFEMVKVNLLFISFLLLGSVIQTNLIAFTYDPLFC